MEAILDEGDEVIVLAPYWTSFPELVRVAGGAPVIVDTRDSSYLLDPDKLGQALTSRTRAIIINSPNNPTGRIYTDRSLRASFELLREKGIFVVADLCYAGYDFTDERRETWATLARGYERLAIVDSFTKSWSIGGWRLGYLAAPREVVGVVNAVQTHTTSNPNCIAQAACHAMLRDGAEGFERDAYRHVRGNRDLAARMLSRQARLRVAPLEGGFFAFVGVSELLGRRHGGAVLENCERLCGKLLERAHVLVVPGDAFGDASGVRLSYAIPTAELELGLQRFLEFAEEVD
jgi:aspartate aminotransferase